MNRSVKNMLVALTLAFTVNSTVFAAPVESSQVKINNIEMNIEKLDNQIEDVLLKLDNNKKQIGNIENEVKDIDKQLKKTEEDIKNHQDIFNSRMRAMYINGSNGYIDMVLDSNDIEDFISRIDMIKSIINFDKNVIANYKTSQNEINSKKDKLIVENNRLLALKTDNENKLSKLNDNKEKQKILIAQAKEHQRLYASVDQTIVDNALKQVDNIRKAASKVNLSRGAAPISNNSVVAYASKFLGTPYLWGGTTSSGFDCSGFTQYVYKNFGISLGRTTYDQINDGVQVSRDQLEVGDLVFFGSGGNPTHVGIYVGQEAYIHSPRTGDVVKVSPLNRGDYITARRVK